MELLQAAEAAVRKAADVCQRVRAEMVTPESIEKKDRSPVTVADLASQAIVIEALEPLGIPVVGEESADALREDAAVRAKVCELAGASEADVMRRLDAGGHAEAKGRFWTLDPIDGTKGFLRNDQYAVALALIEEGTPVLGALACPALNCGTVLAAERGKTPPFSVSTVTDPTQARLVESVESGHSDQDQSVQIARALGIGRDPLRMDSQAKYAAVALGDAEVYLRLPTRPGYRERIWDHGAGLICVECAGGRVTDVDGKPLDFSRGRKLEDNRGVVATSGRFHDAVLSAVSDVLGV
ncbi:MAG: inositol monophosphatase family protein [Planctomycetota bacterium]